MSQPQQYIHILSSRLDMVAQNTKITEYLVIVRSDSQLRVPKDYEIVFVSNRFRTTVLRVDWEEFVVR